MTENNIGLTIGRNYRKSNISTFKPRKLGGILRKEQTRPGFLLVYDQYPEKSKKKSKKLIRKQYNTTRIKARNSLINIAYTRHLFDTSFCQFICQRSNFLYLNRLEVYDPEMTENPLKWFSWLISTSIRRYINVYSMIFAKSFVQNQKRGVDLRALKNGQTRRRKVKILVNLLRIMLREKWKISMRCKR